MPHLADDVFWGVKRLPGAATQDVSAEFNVRGGDADELLVVLDGVELFEPFHLKDFLKAFSIVDASAIGGLDLLTGGFPVEYGGRMSGVMDISTRAPDEDRTTSVTIGTIDSSVLSSGTFEAGRTHWLLTARGWYPDFLLGQSSEIASEILTDYYDLFGKVTHRLDSRATLSVGVLAAYDDLGFRNEELDALEEVDAKYASAHVWMNLQQDWTRTLGSRTVFSGGDVSRRRVGSLADIEDGSVDIDDERGFGFLTLKQDWTLDLRDRHLLKWGFDVKGQRASYDYSRAHSADQRLVRVDYEKAGESYAVYFADRFRLGESLVGEVGVRWDKQFWINDQQLAPRLSLMYTLSSGTVLRTAWGRYHQWQQLNDLQVEDGVDHFHPAQLAEHWLLSLEHRFARNLGLRIEAYDKRVSEPSPRYENLFNPLELFPEAEADRVAVEPDRGRATGIELLLKSDPAREFTWWLGYALSEAVDVFDGVEVPRSWDQRHAATFAMNRRFARGWNVNLAGVYRTGWPISGVTLGEDDEIVFGPRNRERLPSYHRIDARVSRAFETRAGSMTLVAEVMNLTIRDNVCCVDFEVDDGEIVKEYRYWPRVIPSLALRWEF
ncbi:MAG TPA: TonB-dependent receptor [Thermoanaerobaculia bacterium]